MAAQRKSRTKTVRLEVQAGNVVYHDGRGHGQGEIVTVPEQKAKSLLAHGGVRKV